MSTQGKMNNKKVLIITHEGDNACVANVTDYIEQIGGNVIRFDVDKYPTTASLTSSYNKLEWSVELEGTMAQLLDDNLTGVWYRRSHYIGRNLKNLIHDAYLPATLGEVKRTLYGMVESLPCFQMERYSTYRRLDSKEEQLKIAHKCGMQIPATCISNSPQKIKEFMQQVGGEFVAKMQSSFAIVKDNIEQVVFTTLLDPEDIEQLEDIQYCPMIFQEKIEKKLELRVTIVGYEFFAFSIDSQKQEDTKIDWRKDGLSLINEWKPFQLPERIKKSLTLLMDYYQLNYGAIDLIVTPDDEYYFLEINPAGEYFWLDQMCGHAISQQIAKVLIGAALRRE